MLKCLWLVRSEPGDNRRKPAAKDESSNGSNQKNQIFKSANITTWTYFDQAPKRVSIYLRSSEIRELKSINCWTRQGRSLWKLISRIITCTGWKTGLLFHSTEINHHKEKGKKPLDVRYNWPNFGKMKNYRLLLPNRCKFLSNGKPSFPNLFNY